MVAPSATTTPHSAATPNEVVRRMGIGPVRFSISDALEMVRKGILPEDSTIELLDGELIYRDRFDLRGDQIVEGVKHNYVVAVLGDLRSVINTPERHLRTQSTLICADKHAPIPDGIILRGASDAYRDRLPTAADALCVVVEVADASYERDAGEKLSGYARAGIAQYIIVNLRNRTAEIYTNPDVVEGTYAAREVISESGTLAIRVAETEFYQVPLGNLLP